MLDPQHSDLLRGLTPAELEMVLPELQKREYAAGQTILRWGEPGDRLYVIESGLVCAALPKQGGGESVLAQLGPGQMFGEMSILTGQPRSAEIRALVDTVTFTLSVSSFFKVAGRSPTMLLNIGRVLASRLSHMSRATSHRDRRALVVLVGPVPPLVGSLLATNLMAALALVSGVRAMLLDIPTPRAAPLPGRESSPSLQEIRTGAETLAHLSELQSGPLKLRVVNLPDPGALAAPGEAGVASRAVAQLTRVAELIVVNLCGPYSELRDELVPMASRVYIVGASGVSRDGELTELAERCRGLLSPRAAVGMIALSGDGSLPAAIRARMQALTGIANCAVLPGQAELLREAARVEPPMTQHAPHLAASKAITRLAREVAGLRVGLALAGGAARGVAHVGVVAALDRLGVPIDVVTGTSVGAVVAAGVAMGMDLRQIEESMGRLIDLWGQALRPVLSRVSLVSPKGLERIVREAAGDIQFDELAIPCGAVATDLNTGRAVYISQGSVAQAIRASISIPLIFPPVQLGEYALVDGQVVNPVPTLFARQLGADVVLACSLSGAIDQVDRNPLSLEPPAQVPVVRKKLPNVLQTYLRVMELMMAGDEEHDCLSADLTFRPRLPSLGLKEFQKGGAPLLAGEQAVEAEVEGLRELFPWLRVAS